MREDTIKSLCPYAFEKFKEFITVDTPAYSDFFRLSFYHQVGVFFEFFKRQNEKYESDKIRRILLEHSLVEPIDNQVNDVYRLFISLEAELRKVPA